MADIDLMTVAGYFSITVMAFTFLLPLVIALKNCRAEKRERRLHAQNPGHSLS